ncbi:MAG: SgcJ/EcaC family oxidoreductase [Burkholderiales bacterium]|jgi:uncharacterized protein (TIGR02246 family)|nr:SgcJ/EcaC family oxidoreductase [Burkholderiales bacterium]
MHPDEQAIRDVHATWIAAVNAGDLAELQGLMTHDAVFMNPGSEAVGPDGFPAGFGRAQRQFQVRCVSEPREVAISGDLAYVCSRDSLSLMPRDGGQPLALAGDRLTVYRKEPDGRWRLARDAHTLSPVIARG